MLGLDAEQAIGCCSPKCAAENFCESHVQNCASLEQAVGRSCLADRGHRADGLCPCHLLRCVITAASARVGTWLGVEVPGNGGAGHRHAAYNQPGCRTDYVTQVAALRCH